MSERYPTSLEPQDLETLAAFVDGRLEGAKKQAVQARLARDPSYYEVYAETLHFLEEEEEHSEGAPRVDELRRERHRPRRLRWVLPAAVAAVLAAALSWWQLAPRAAPGAGRYLAALHPAKALPPALLQADLAGWHPPRGAAEPSPALGQDGIDVRLGVHHIALVLALTTGDAQQARRHAARIDTLLRASQRPILLDVAGRVRRAVTTGSHGAPRAAADALSRDLDTVLGGHAGYRLGAWAQSCRVAAATGDADFFDRGMRRELRRVGAATLVPDAADALATIEGWLARGLTPAGLESLGQACQTLATRGGNLATNARR